jgi:hypothetical protein
MRVSLFLFRMRKKIKNMEKRITLDRIIVFKNLLSSTLGFLFIFHSMERKMAMMKRRSVRRKSIFAHVPATLKIRYEVSEDFSKGRYGFFMIWMSRNRNRRNSISHNCLLMPHVGEGLFKVCGYVVVLIPIKTLLNEKSI